MTYRLQVVKLEVVSRIRGVGVFLRPCAPHLYSVPDVPRVPDSLSKIELGFDFVPDKILAPLFASKFIPCVSICYKSHADKFCGTKSKSRNRVLFWTENPVSGTEVSIKSCRQYQVTNTVGSKSVVRSWGWMKNAGIMHLCHLCQ